MVDKIYSETEIIDALKSKAVATTDSFRVKVNRRQAPHLPPELLATFDGVNVSSILEPELWALELFGGGAFEFTMAHASDVNSFMPGPKKATFDTTNYPPRKPSYAEVVAACSQTSWVGPTQIIYPRPTSIGPGIAATTVAPGHGITQLTIDGKNQALPANLSTTSVGGNAMAPLQQTMATSTNPIEQREAGRLMQVSENLARTERDLMEQRLSLQIEKARPSDTRGPGIGEMLTSMTPLLLAFLDQKSKTDAMLFQAQQDAATRQLEMMRLMMMKPAIDPEMKALLEKASEKKDDFGQMKGMAEMMGTMANVSMQIIQSNAELMAASQPQQESPAYKLARQAMVALSAIMGKTQVQMLPDNDGEVPALPAQAAAAPAPEGEKQKFSQLELLERSIRRLDDKDLVAERFLKTLKSPKFKAFIHQQYQGNFLRLVEDRLGVWAAEKDENLTYLQEVIPYIWGRAGEVGLIPKVVEKPVENPPVEAAPPALVTPPPTEPVEEPKNGSSEPEIPVAPKARKLKVNPPEVAQ